MTDPRALDALDQMLDAARQALAYVGGSNLDQFRVDRRTQQAVTLNLLIIGETAARFAQIFPQLAAGAPDVPWQSMRGMRNRIAHGYYSVDIDLVWRTTVDSLPRLIEAIARLRSTLAADDR